MKLFSVFTFYVFFSLSAFGSELCNVTVTDNSDEWVGNVACDSHDSIEDQFAAIRDLKSAIPGKVYGLSERVLAVNKALSESYELVSVANLAPGSLLIVFKKK